MHFKENNLLSLFLLLVLTAALMVAGCSGLKSQWRKVSGTRPADADLEEEAKVPPESIQEEVVVDGKTYVRSKNPEYNYMVGEPEYIYAEKGTEFIGLTARMVESLARRLGIDELPQLFNVLRGEMSLIGPRPDVIPYGNYLPWQRRRFDVLPGITGLWQVNGKNQTTLTTMIQLDIQYVDRRSLWLDLAILPRTIPAVLKG